MTRAVEKATMTIGTNLTMDKKKPIRNPVLAAVAENQVVVGTAKRYIPLPTGFLTPFYYEINRNNCISRRYAYP